MPAEDAELIASVPPELLPPPEGPVADRPVWAGRPPKRRERGDSYRWLCYQDGYRAAARHRGGYRIVSKPALPEELSPYQKSLDRLAAATIYDEMARATVRDEVWALTQLLWAHAELVAKVAALKARAAHVNAGAILGSPTQTLDAAGSAIADRIRRMEYYVQTVQAAEAEQAAVEHEVQRASLQPLLRGEALQYSGEALDLLARASGGSLAPQLPAPPRKADPPERDPLPALQRKAGDLVERIQAMGADAPPDLAVAARHLKHWLER
ncbi:hypothetical protein [Streptomyces antibioticus]|uniref:hypothetical protein n=1 Tax=Streptomyces antibioticus TaxID=1890 RepID=UPI00339EEA6D